MPVLAPKQILALLWEHGVRQSEPLRNLTALALACSGGEVSKVVTPTGTTTAEDGTTVPRTFYGLQRGLWLISDSRGYDQKRMVSDAAYATTCVIAQTRRGTELSGWGAWNNGSYQQFLPVAIQAEAEAARVSGSILAEDGTYVPATYYSAAPSMGQPSNLTAFDRQSIALGNVQRESMPAPVVPPPTIGGPATPLTASFQKETPLRGLRITGTQLTSDLSSIVIGDPGYAAAIGEVPNLAFTIADPQGDLLWKVGNLWVQGAKVQYLDLDMRIDEIKFAPGGHTTGQLEITAIDALVFALQRLRGARVEKNVSPTTFIREEIRRAGFDPNAYFLGENLPKMAQIARDVPTENQQGGDQDPPSAWTTVQRLAKETGRRAFICGRKLMFGTLAFCRDWSGPGDLRIGYHGVSQGEKWLNLPTADQNSGGSTAGGTTVTGRVPLNRARYFRPGVGVIVSGTPSVAAGPRKMVCTSIEHSLSRDIDGAEIKLMDPVEAKPEKR